MRFAFIATEKACYPVALMCRLNHWRFSSTRLTSAIGVPQIKAARRDRSSNSCSGSVSRIA